MQKKSDGSNEAVSPENRKKYNHTQRIAISAMMLAISSVIAYFTRISIPIGGIPGLRISFNGVFLQFVSVVFGPVFGGAIGAASDVIMVFLRNEGSYMFQFTVVAFLKGASIGALWKLIKKVNMRFFAAGYSLFFGAVGLLGMINLSMLSQGSQSGYSSFLLGLGTKIDYASSGLIICGLLGLVTWIILRDISPDFEKYLKLIVVIGIPSLIFTTVNTWLIVAFVTDTPTSFMLFWIPRFIKEILSVLFNTYVLAAMLAIYEKTFKAKA